MCLTISSPIALAPRPPTTSRAKQATARADIENGKFHDLRPKAIADVDEDRGIGQAQRTGGHSTQAQTADYVHHKEAMQTEAIR